MITEPYYYLFIGSNIIDFEYNYRDLKNQYLILLKYLLKTSKETLHFANDMCSHY
jgi:hypothetical protein